MIGNHQCLSKLYYEEELLTVWSLTFIVHTFIVSIVL